MSDTTVPSEPLRRTLLRNITIALIAAFVASQWMGGVRRWPVLIVLALWPSFGGHYVDLTYLHWIRPHVSNRRLRVLARIATWAIGGVVLAAGMLATARILSAGVLHWPGWWLGAIALIGIELLAHLGLQFRGAPSFYNGRG